MMKNKVLCISLVISFFLGVSCSRYPDKAGYPIERLLDKQLTDEIDEKIKKLPTPGGGPPPYDLVRYLSRTRQFQDRINAQKRYFRQKISEDEQRLQRRIKELDDEQSQVQKDIKELQQDNIKATEALAATQASADSTTDNTEDTEETEEAKEEKAQAIEDLTNLLKNERAAGEAAAEEYLQNLEKARLEAEAQLALAQATKAADHFVSEAQKMNPSISTSTDTDGIETETSKDSASSAPKEAAATDTENLATAGQQAAKQVGQNENSPPVERNNDLENYFKEYLSPQNEELLTTEEHLVCNQNHCAVTAMAGQDISQIQQVVVVSNQRCFCSSAVPRSYNLVCYDDQGAVDGIRKVGLYKCNGQQTYAVRASGGVVFHTITSPDGERYRLDCSGAKQEEVKINNAVVNCCSSYNDRSEDGPKYVCAFLASKFTPSTRLQEFKEAKTISVQGKKYDVQVQLVGP